MSALAASSRRSRRDEFRQALTVVGLGVVPGLVTMLVMVTVLRSHWVAYDFHWSYYPAAARLLHGGNPYAVTRFDIVKGIAFVYPALSAVALAPFALLSRSDADHLYSLLLLLLIPASLWMLGIRDWRIYGAPLIWLPVIVGWQGGNESVPLCFMAAVLWRYRDRPLVAGLVTAAPISLKPFVWPLALWLLATRRWKAAAWALAWGVALNLFAWSIVGFSEIHTYLHLSGEVTTALWRGGYGMLAVAHYLGLGRGAGEVMMAVASLALVAGVLRAGMQRRQTDAFVLAVALMLVASPLVWSHYFTFLVLPLALRRPRFSALWLVPVAMWVCPPSMTVVGWEAAVAWLVAIACFASWNGPNRSALAWHKRRQAFADRVGQAVRSCDMEPVIRFVSRARGLPDRCSGGRMLD